MVFWGSHENKTQTGRFELWLASGDRSVLRTGRPPWKTGFSTRDSRHLRGIKWCDGPERRATTGIIE